MIVKQEVRERLAPGMVNIVYGAHDLDMDLAGLTVEEIQFSLSNVLSVDMAAEAYLDGNLIENRTIAITPGSRLEFMKSRGRKSVGQTWTKPEFMQVFRMTEADWADWAANGLPFDGMKDGTIILNETEVDRWKEAQRGNKPDPESIVVLKQIASAAEEIAHSLGSYPTGHTALTEGERFNASVEAKPQQRSPYLDADEAARYLGITVKSLYGVVERRHLIPLRGPRRTYRFTEEMLDEYLKRQRR
jgi:excisionase family DNA binding protein